MAALWETVSKGPSDLDIPDPVNVRHRLSFGQMWYVGTTGAGKVIRLVVDVEGRPWLVLDNDHKYPASRSGWQDMIDYLVSRFAQYRPER